MKASSNSNDGPHHTTSHSSCSHSGFDKSPRDHSFRRSYQLPIFKINKLALVFIILLVHIASVNCEHDKNVSNNRHDIEKSKESSMGYGNGQDSSSEEVILNDNIN